MTWSINFNNVGVLNLNGSYGTNSDAFVVGPFPSCTTNITGGPSAANSPTGPDGFTNHSTVDQPGVGTLADWVHREPADQLRLCARASGAAPGSTRSSSLRRAR